MFHKSMMLRNKGQSDILMKSQTVCRHSNSLDKKGQSTGPNCINCFSKSYWKNLCSSSLHIGLFYLKNLNAYKQFGSSSKCQINPFCATPSKWCSFISLVLVQVCQVCQNKGYPTVGVFDFELYLKWIIFSLSF